MWDEEPREHTEYGEAGERTRVGHGMGQKGQEVLAKGCYPRPSEAECAENLVLTQLLHAMNKHREVKS